MEQIIPNYDKLRTNPDHFIIKTHQMIRANPALLFA